MSDSQVIGTIIGLIIFWLINSMNKVSNSIKELTEYLKERDKK
ncbi:hypothetical protein ACOJIU_17930 (plasmid) [Carnobacterium maltaromaticum]|nr:hypothetical protein [Carnobacterium maltaromaticum]